MYGLFSSFRVSIYPVDRFCQRLLKCPNDLTTLSLNFHMNYTTDYVSMGTTDHLPFKCCTQVKYFSTLHSPAGSGNTKVHCNDNMVYNSNENSLCIFTFYNRFMHYYA